MSTLRVISPLNPASHSATVELNDCPSAPAVYQYGLPIAANPLVPFLDPDRIYLLYLTQTGLSELGPCDFFSTGGPAGIYVADPGAPTTLEALTSEEVSFASIDLDSGDTTPMEITVAEAST